MLCLNTRNQNDLPVQIKGAESHLNQIYRATYTLRPIYMQIISGDLPERSLFISRWMASALGRFASFCTGYYIRFTLFDR